jgi:hypothetical protein
MYTANPRARRTIRGLAAAGVSLVAALLVVTMPVTAATTYKWVDKQGQVHYSDSPPPGVAYETVATPSHPAAAPPPRAPESTSTSQPDPVPPPAPPAASMTAGIASDADCVDALYQIALLEQKRPVFRFAADGSRQYLDDDARPAELERLQRLRDANCSEDTAARRSQQQRADAMMVTLSPGCAEARDKLASYEDPATHTPDDQIERQRAIVARDCPETGRTDLWIGDWIRVGVRH